MMTPIRLGITVASRLPICFNMAGAKMRRVGAAPTRPTGFLHVEGAMPTPSVPPIRPRGQNRRCDEHQHFVRRRRFCPPYASSSSLRERAIIQPAVEPILISSDVLLHRDVHIGLEQRNPRHIG